MDELDLEQENIPNEKVTRDNAREDAEDIERLLDEFDKEDEEDDIGKIKSKYMSTILPDDDDLESNRAPIDAVTKRDVQELIESIPKPMVQKPIQPGSSPNDEQNRFLCWNNTGIIRAQNGGEDQSIDVMFHDTERHSSLNFKNEPNYSFGSMSDDVIVVGSNGKYGTGPASIHGINLLETNRDQREWELELPHVELIEALAVGAGFVAVATDQRYLRLFTNGGMQSFVFTLPGQILCMVAYERQLMLIYHDGAGHSDDQNLNMFVYYMDLQSNILRQTHRNLPVALGKRSPLAWAGFSDEGSPCTYDFSGMLRIFRPELGQVWVPLLDLRDLTSSALDHFFVVGVSEITQAVRAVKCKKSRYPEFTRDTAELFSFSLPMCEMDTDQGKLEEEHVRLRLAGMSYKRMARLGSLRSVAMPASDANEKLLVNNVLKLFATYLKEDKEELARSLVYMIPRDHMSKLPEFAWKINRPQYFIDSLNRAVEEREQLESELRTIREEDDDSISVVSVHDNHHNFGRDLRRELSKCSGNNDGDDGMSLKPIPLDKLKTNSNGNDRNNKPPPIIEDDDSEDENDDAKQSSKRTKTISYNLFSKNKKPKVS